MTKARDTAEDTSVFKVLVLHIGAHCFGLPIDKIEDVIQRSPTTPVPLVSDRIVGLLNLRGHIVTEVDVSRILDIPKVETAVTAGTIEGFSVVVSHGVELYSLVFDRVGDVVDLDRNKIEPLPFTIQQGWSALSPGVCRMGAELVVVLDINRLIEHLTADTVAA